MFGDKAIQDLLNEIGRASDSIDKAVSRVDDVAVSAGSIEEEAEDARDAANDAGRAITELEMKLKTMIEQTSPDLDTKLDNIDAAMRQLRDAVNDLRFGGPWAGDHDR
jgi:methyl-accepting chemotaxis protein